MSGGHFDYNQHRFNDVADEIENLIAKNGKENEYGYSYSYSEETLEKFREAAKTARTAAKMTKMVDYLVCSDTGEDSFHVCWKKELE